MSMKTKNQYEIKNKESSWGRRSRIIRLWWSWWVGCWCWRNDRGRYRSGTRLLLSKEREDELHHLGLSGLNGIDAAHQML